MFRFVAQAQVQKLGFGALRLSFASSKGYVIGLL